mmetsp:Transcript_79372/g.157273  ORF Transcript_79372/g.157273 Transcript_79372/m.157273 type:complete len:133 (-) Transcript_79372:38-436(-)
MILGAHPRCISNRRVVSVKILTMALEIGRFHNGAPLRSKSRFMIRGKLESQVSLVQLRFCQSSFAALLDVSGSELNVRVSQGNSNLRADCGLRRAESEYFPLAASLYSPALQEETTSTVQKCSVTELVSAPC